MPAALSGTTNVPRIKPQGAIRALAPICLLTLLSSAGCQKPAEEIPPAPSPAAAGKTANVEAQKQIQDNPNIPPQAKAAIAAHMQGKAAPNEFSPKPQ